MKRSETAGQGRDEPMRGIPMLLAGPGIPEGARVDAPVSLVDVFQTTLDSLGVPAHPDDADLPGHSLVAMANGAASLGSFSSRRYWRPNLFAGSWR
jgi:choline-sulfatase